MTDPTHRQTVLWAVADLHVANRENRNIVERLVPPNPDDWLIVAGDVAERPELILETLKSLAERYAQVIWVPGNHDLFCRGTDEVTGEDRYLLLVEGCRSIGVLTPEDPFPTFGEVTVCPLFVLYDYSWRDPRTTVDEALNYAVEQQMIFTDEFAIKPFEDPILWCRRRLSYTVRRMSRVTGPTILVNHWPLIREPVNAMAFPTLGMWCGTRHTEDWPQRYNAETVVYGHLHIPDDRVIDGVRHIEASLGYPREWRRQPTDRTWPIPVKEV